ncbi:chromosome segregation protein SMC [Alteromonas macleodii]|uniref:Chromosome partition protein Smc n=1 Tax=Alteromonas macleodii (strain English Channel 673) TaxID=1004788 RepID=A0AB32ZY36_ALTME|nr:chromosome segregation protein SMC [Alteromonas macleodii]AFT74555.1 chromosome segregation ATPase [Alteromonas macleodii str. 'English Channel 673']MBL3809378.1 chromosome segregation protein SMC [Alteromonas macleodii]MBL3882915.1 chromosome segregation protein SMC [Alteromonas macleodii]
MRLKKIKLAGFKSFVEPTTIPFPGEMTAIVGPNGCGKSNVIDAVRWVLGESSAKNLRGDAMTDVIFNGSSSRKPVGQCSVELVFDNSAGRIAGEFANYNELSVKRLVTRDATSTYFLNGTKCRRRDVTDLFLGTGLGPRSYAIIEQGMISRLIESKPQDLRVFIEEAAGISKYKERRRETENRIRHTQDNLERLNDVRDELGKQLEKLQRQAAAATRYKTLRAQARELKGQLAALRFLKNSEHIEALQKQQQALQLEVDDLVARLQGDEAGLESYKTKQLETKQTIDDLQQQLFTTSNAITRLEQNALHAKQRKGQVEQELARISEQHELLNHSIDEAQEALAVSNEALENIEPEFALKEAELEHAKERFEDAEQALREFNAQARAQEQTYNQLRQNVQQCHSQIQSTMSMQLRTSQRISELQDELKQLDEEDFASQITLLEEQCSELDFDIDEAKQLLQESNQKVSQQQGEVNAIEAKRRDTQGQLQTALSTKAALEALQQDASNNEDVTLDGIEKLWQQFSSNQALAPCVESILQHTKDPVVAKSHDIQALLQNHAYLPSGIKVFTDKAFVSTAKSGSLAHALLTESSTNESSTQRVPAFFNDIYLCSNDDELAETIESAFNNDDEPEGLAKGFTSAISPSGLWASSQWVVKPGEASDGALQRANKIKGLVDSIQESESLIDEIEHSVECAKQALEQSEAQKQAIQSALGEKENQRAQIKNKLSLLEMQQEQQSTRTAKLNDELAKQELMLAKEEEQLAQLSEKLELQEAQILEHEVHIDDVNAKRDANERTTSELRALVDTLTSQNHELALKKQQLENHQNLYSQQVTRNLQQREEYIKNKERLQKELTQLTSPEEIQEAELQSLLENKAELEQLKSAKQSSLEDIEQWLREAEKGHQALGKDIQTRQTNIDKLNIDIEGYRVRANTILEQLDETQQSLKSILETLPEDAEEKRWQEDLEKTQANLQRLGAVNLAAVEEYETQSERKSHLDTQHNDLTEALETLQSAIRKIDKETRTRFSTTFEQVNEDLKTLFPKVFGGGSAYLALTDDDLLETGVTIMARPPGKKNSTIHLLSGGEKALTALSLVFAIFRLNPAPFCLLDEVDAPLDDANVGRFCNLVSEMSQTVQFIYITHNKIAMEMASHLTGVTMAEPGVSRMVAVDVDEAVAFAEA